MERTGFDDSQRRSPDISLFPIVLDCLFRAALFRTQRCKKRAPCLGETESNPFERLDWFYAASLDLSPRPFADLDVPSTIFWRSHAAGGEREERGQETEFAESRDDGRDVAVVTSPDNGSDGVPKRVSDL